MVWSRGEADRHRIHRELIKQIFEEPKLRAYRHKNLRGFRVSLKVDGEMVDSDGEIPFNLSLTNLAEQRNRPFGSPRSKRSDHH